MLVGPCVCGVHSVLLEGSFAYPDPLRFARAALEHKVTLFKTGSALLRQLMVDPNLDDALGPPSRHFATVRMATFCAEPVSTAVQEFGCSLSLIHI